MSFTYNDNAFASNIKFPDTPEARRIADMLSAQQQRRHSAHQSLFKTSEPATEVATPMPSAFKTMHNQTDIGPRKLFDDASADGSSIKPAPPEFISVEDADCSADQMHAAVLNAMLTGSDQIIQQTSAQVYDALISTASVPSQVAEQKKNKAASVNSFIARFKEIDKQLIFPSTQQGKPLRETVKSLMSDINREYKTLSHSVFNAQLILAMLVQTIHSTKLVTQSHRFVLCQDIAAFTRLLIIVRSARQLQSRLIIRFPWFNFLDSNYSQMNLCCGYKFPPLCLITFASCQVLQSRRLTQNPKMSLRNCRQPTSIQFKSSLILRSAVTIRIPVLLQQLNEQLSITSTVVSRSWLPCQVISKQN